MSQRVCVLLAFVSLITFGISASSADKGKGNRIPDEARASDTPAQVRVTV